MLHQEGDQASAPPWPLAGSKTFASLGATTRERLASHLNVTLRQDVLTSWFVHSVDRKQGGFLPDLDRRWRPAGPQERMLEFQARQTLSAARLAKAFPSEPRWQELAMHGFRYLRDRLWDHQHGGWYWLLDATGQPLAHGSKHAHSTAYAIRACVAIFRASGEPEALSLAFKGVDWLERCLHDPVHGGYYGWARRDGTPILNQTESPDGRATSDPLGHGIGHKDINVTSDLYETFTDLNATAPSPLTSQRVAELRECIGKMMTPEGALHYAAHPDWLPVPGLERFGYGLQTAFRLVRGESLRGGSTDKALHHARCLVNHAIEVGWHRSGGFMTGGPASPPYSLEGHRLMVSTRSWWVQLEGLRSLTLLAVQDHPTGAFFATRLDAHLNFIDQQMRDHRFGGWYAIAHADLPRLDRMIPWRRRLSLFKGNPWKDCSHEVDAYLNGIRMLRGLHPEAPLCQFV